MSNLYVVVAEDLGNGFHQWVSEPQPTPEAAWAAAWENHRLLPPDPTQSEWPRLEVVDYPPYCDAQERRKSISCMRCRDILPWHLSQDEAWAIAEKYHLQNLIYDDQGWTGSAPDGFPYPNLINNGRVDLADLLPEKLAQISL